MSITSKDLAIIYPEQLLIPFSQDDKQQAWQKATQNNQDNKAVIWNSFLNHLCLQYIPYLKSDITDNVTIQTWQSEAKLNQIWQLVNGNAIDIVSENSTTTRLVLIPTNEETDELRVPREWLDLPNWVGNYYIAVQINEQENYLTIQGYTTYEELTEYGNYDAIDETYSLPLTNLTEDLTSMYISLELYPYHRPQLKNEYILDSDKLPEIVSQLKSTTMTLPRLEIPFTDWGAIIDNPETRYFFSEDKYNQNNKEESIVNNDKVIKDNQGVKLLQWLEDAVTSGWQTLDSLINQEQLNLAYNYRRSNSDNSVEAVKLVEIPTNTGMQTLALVIHLEKTPEGKFTLKIQLNSTAEKSTLPSQLKLQMVSYSQKIIQEVEARDNDNSIQLKQFTTRSGQKFLINIVQEKFTWVEQFSVS